MFCCSGIFHSAILLSDQTAQRISIHLHPVPLKTPYTASFCLLGEHRQIQRKEAVCIYIDMTFPKQLCWDKISGHTLKDTQKPIQQFFNSWVRSLSLIRITRPDLFIKNNRFFPSRLFNMNTSASSIWQFVFQHMVNRFLRSIFHLMLCCCPSAFFQPERK